MKKQQFLFTDLFLFSLPFWLSHYTYSGNHLGILGLSMGEFIAQELTLLHPEKVNRLIIHASSYGGKELLPPQVSPEVMTSMISGNASIDTFTSTLFPKEWIKQHVSNFLKYL